MAVKRSEHYKRREISSSRPHPVDPLTMSHFGPPDSKRQRVGRPFLEGPGPRSAAQSKAARQCVVKFSRDVWPVPQQLPACSLTPVSLEAPERGGRGSLKGRGGFSSTLPPLQGKFVMQLA